MVDKDKIGSEFHFLTNTQKQVLGEEAVEAEIRRLYEKEEQWVKDQLIHLKNGGDMPSFDNLFCKGSAMPTGGIETKNWHWGTKMHNGNIKDNYLKKRDLLSDVFYDGAPVNIVCEILLMFGGEITLESQDTLEAEDVIVIHDPEPILPEEWLTAEEMQDQRKRIVDKVGQAYRCMKDRMKITKPVHYIKSVLTIFKVNDNEVLKERIAPSSTFVDSSYDLKVENGNHDDRTYVNLNNIYLRHSRIIVLLLLLCFPLSFYYIKSPDPPSL